VSRYAGMCINSFLRRVFPGHRRNTSAGSCSERIHFPCLHLKNPRKKPRGFSNTTSLHEYVKMQALLEEVSLKRVGALNKAATTSLTRCGGFQNTRFPTTEPLISFWDHGASDILLRGGSARFVSQYQESVGGCHAGFHVSVLITGI
jgi:hypothetical protein